jgi:hypothetical protein
MNLAEILYPNQGKEYGDRPDGTKKGRGFLGEMQRLDGGVSTEISAGFEIDGKEVDIPLMVPSLTKKEIDYLLNADTQGEEFFKNMPESIADKAIDHAKKRMKEGKSVFYVDGEDDK